MNYRNPAYNHLGTIDCEIEHPVHGWVPTTLAPDDTQEAHAELYAAVLAAGNITAFVPPTADEVRQNMPVLSARQFWMAAAGAGVTKDQVLATASVIEDPLERSMTTVEISEATSFDRLHPTVVAMSVNFNIPAEQLDDLWLWAAQL